MQEALKEQKIYTEYDAQRRAEEIAAARLEDIIAKVSECTSNCITLLNANEKLTGDLKNARAGLERMTRAAIAYDEIYSRMSDAAKAEFKEIEKEVSKIYGFSDK